MGELLKFRKRKGGNRRKRVFEPTSSTISLDERREEASLRRHYDSLVAMEDQMREDGHDVLDKKVFYRRVRSWGSSRRTPVTLKFIDESLRVLQREEASTISMLETDAAAASPEQRVLSDTKYRRTRQWLQRKGYIPDDDN